MLHKWHKRTPAAIYTQKETILAIKFYLYACIDLFTDFQNIGSHCMCFSPLQGCLSNWFRAHPDLLQVVLPIILDGLTNPGLASSAALAFRDVCGDCAEHLAPAVMQIIPVCQVIMHSHSLLYV